MRTYVHLWQYLAELFLEWEKFQTEAVEETRVLLSRRKKRDAFMFQNIFPKIVPFMI
jgi:hypothetical protein